LEKLHIDNYEFLTFSEENARIFFSTSKGDLNFNINEACGESSLMKVKELFKLAEVGFLRQTHSCSIFEYDGTVHTGDAIITNKKDAAIGVFTADCVPVMLFDKEKQVIAAVHSGWKGTFDEITLKTVLKMHRDYGSKPENITAYIGPHNRGCCYEIGKDVEMLFASKELYNDIQIIDNGRLDLEKCIIKQLKSSGIKEDNIKSTGICTFCSNEYSLHSYRKHREASGRMFSFIYLT
jgi:polyphenol oxidase